MLDKLSGEYWRQDWANVNWQLWRNIACLKYSKGVYEENAYTILGSVYILPMVEISWQIFVGYIEERGETEINYTDDCIF